ncbi:hypothetical protein VFPFJ_03922 [Purpureocillium lilacinum]|uniref:Uncharacterized protein n=1 Tax=Purpureocillium lilacinum TaxID=33203 RepID=A0A179GXB6_PURLI|nr:hypothetical protein VFPFJ_03922 [Purpureocillium lilacinum]OAQ82138.1 hypothetical protein VFPBJ_04722 [Purpureocillium lilacinum]OAQ92182.1 hypothetical protein VFPFJ_03922 [Purpureocillium lilacinum]
MWSETSEQWFFAAHAKTDSSKPQAKRWATGSQWAAIPSRPWRGMAARHSRCQERAHGSRGGRGMEGGVPAAMRGILPWAYLALAAVVEEGGRTAPFARLLRWER